MPGFPHCFIQLQRLFSSAEKAVCVQIPSPALSPELKMACLQIHALQYEGEKKLATQHMS